MHEMSDEIGDGPCAEEDTQSTSAMERNEWASSMDLAIWLYTGEDPWLADSMYYPGASECVWFPELLVQPVWENPDPDLDLPRWLYGGLLSIGGFKRGSDEVPFAEAVERLRSNLLTNATIQNASEFQRGVMDLWKIMRIALATGEVAAWAVREGDGENLGRQRVPPEVFAGPTRISRDSVVENFPEREVHLWRHLVIRTDELVACLRKSAGEGLMEAVTEAKPETSAEANDARKSRASQMLMEGPTKAKTRARAEADAARNSRALQIMMIIQEEEIAARGRPLKVRALGRELKKRSGLPARLADSLSVLLPSTHKLPDRR